MLYKRKLTGFICSALSFAVFASGCAAEQSAESSSSRAVEEESSQQLSASAGSSIQYSAEVIPQELKSVITDLFSDRDLGGEIPDADTEITLNGSEVQINGDGASAEGSDIIITKEGVYRFTGALDDGQIIVNADSQEKIQLILDNASVACSDSSAVYVQNADKVFITVPEGCESTLSDGETYTYTDASANEPDSAVFSADSLTINGGGTLNINGNYNEAVTSKDDIVITTCTLNIASKVNAVKGKDYVAVSGAEINIKAGGDGIKSTNIDEEGLGFVYVQDGNITINSAEDGIQADGEFICDGGSFDITSGGGSASAQPRNGNDFGGGFRRDMQTETTETEDTTISCKGIKGSAGIFIRGGGFNVDSSDDAVHSNSYTLVSDGMLTLSSGDDGIHSDAQLDITGGDITISESYEGIEAAVINAAGGNIDLKASDDGFNAGDGTAQGGMGTYSDGVMLNISAGTLIVDAGGDGLDSNGNMIISGGTVLVNGPTNDGNGALDGNGEMVCHGGIVVAAGSSGMAEYPGNSSTQNVMSATLDSTQQANTLVTLCGKDGEEILSFAPAKTFNSIVISTPDIVTGETYTLYTGGTSDASALGGLYENGGYKNDGTEAGSFTAEGTVSFIGGSQGMMNHGGNFGGGGKDFGGGRGGREDFELPTNENGETDMQIPDGGFGGREDMQLPTDENGNMAIEIPTNAGGQPDMQRPGGGFGGDFGNMQPPTDENGEIAMDMPQGGFGEMIPGEQSQS